MPDENESQDQKQSSVDSKGRHSTIREDGVEGAVDAIVEGGRPRLFRSVPELLASGIIAGVEIGLGVLAFLAVEHSTGSTLLAGIAFGVGFVALLLGNSELFTEGFLVPVAVVVAKEATWWRLVRFWLVTLVGNVAGGWLVMWMVVTAFPELDTVVVETGDSFATSSPSMQTFVLSVLAGSVMTLLTRMRIGTANDTARIIACFTVAFLVAGMSMHHSVLDTLFIFGGIQAGGSYDYLDWIAFFGWAAAGNMIGGIGLTGLLRLIRGHERLYEWRKTQRPGPTTTAS